MGEDGSGAAAEGRVRAVKPPPDRLYGRQRGQTLRARQRLLLTETLPRLRFDHAATPAAAFADPPSQIWLEVGFGGGEHLAAQAAAHPDIGLIGGEVFRNGVASLLGHLAVRADPDTGANLRIFPDDVRRLLPALPDACLDKVFVLFPDPWPKSRHSGRRFIGPANLPELARVLADGGELRVASDDPGTIAWTRSQLAAHTALFARVGEWSARPAEWPGTRYESKAVAQGRGAVWFSFIRIPRGHG